MPRVFFYGVFVRENGFLELPRNKKVYYIDYFRERSGTWNPATWLIPERSGTLRSGPLTAGILETK